MMKTQKSISAKMIAMAIMLFSMLTMAACGQEKSSSNDEKETATTPSVKAPQMDIFTASLMGNINAINQHISAGTDLNKKDNYGSTPLTIAATFGKTEVAKALIEGGADLNMKNNEGSTPLHVAAFFCRTEIVKALLEKGADKNVKNSYGSTPLESVSGPFAQVKPIYIQMNKDLGALGLKLDYDRLEKTRPQVAEMLR